VACGPYIPKKVWWRMRYFQLPSHMPGLQPAAMVLEQQEDKKDIQIWNAGGARGEAEYGNGQTSATCLREKKSI